MKKGLSILAVFVMTFGVYSCETDSIAEDEQLFINATDDDDKPNEERGND